MTSLQELALDAFEDREEIQAQEKALKASKISALVQERLGVLLSQLLGADWETAHAATWEGDHALIDGVMFTLVPTTGTFNEALDVQSGRLVATVGRESGWPTSGDVKSLADLGALYAQAEYMNAQAGNR